MARAKAKLGVASRRDVQSAAQAWDDAVLQCRTRGHIWEQTNAYHVKRYHYWHVVFTCDRQCGCQKWEEWTNDGIIVASTIRYPRDEDGNHLYLLDGVGRMDAEGRGALRIEAVSRIGFVEINSVEESEETLPHSSATRTHLEGTGQWPT